MSLPDLISTTSNDLLTTCAVHQDRETGLQCERCQRYMCLECAVITPQSRLCRECAQLLAAAAPAAAPASVVDGAIVFLTCFVLGALAGLLPVFVTLGIFLIFTAVPIGALIAEVALRAVNRRRGRLLEQLAAAGVVLGGALVGVITGSLIVVWTLVFVGLVAVVVYGRFQGRF